MTKKAFDMCMNGTDKDLIAARQKDSKDVIKHILLPIMEKDKDRQNQKE